MRPGRWVGLLLVAAPSLVAADELAFTAALSCQPALDSGRLVCNVDYRSTSGARIVWADVVITRAPSFVRPLRARASATLERDGASGRAAIALVSTPARDGAASGPISVRARAVVCGNGEADAGGCTPIQRELNAELTLP
jgi:hypothetical protein